MKVWMTRSRPGADRQAADLREAGHRVLVAPVIHIDPVDAPVPAGPFDLVIFLSEHGVAEGLPVLKRTPWFSGCRVLAVGARTAAVLEEQGVAARSPADATSEGLLAMPDLSRLADRRVLLVTGQGGRDLLARELGARGALVARFECYRRVRVADLDARVLDCDAVIAASGEGLEQVARLWLRAGGRADVPVLVPSARVVARGVELGFANLHDCGGADSEAFIRELAQLQSAGRS